MSSSGGRNDLDLPDLVNQLCAAGSSIRRGAACERLLEPLPSRAVVGQLSEAFRAALFPEYFGSSEVRTETLVYHLGHIVDDLRRTLQLQIKRGLALKRQGALDHASLDRESAELTATLLNTLPEIQRQLGLDVQAAYEGDPASLSADEAIFCAPGVLAMISHRVAHELERLKVPLLPRMMAEYSHSRTGIDIHPGATIGERFFIDHGTGVVVGETCIIGNRVRIYQGVTLGAKSFPLDEKGNPVKGIPRHPIIEDDVIIYSGATILGRITVGRGSMVGGNVWLTRSIAPDSRITLNPPRKETFEGGGGI
jgi:serine O-acetyltransferase